MLELSLAHLREKLKMNG